MQLTIEVSEQDLLELGRETLEKELQATLKALRQRHRLALISETLRETHTEAQHQHTVEQIRAEAWHEYKQNLGL